MRALRLAVVLAALFVGAAPAQQAPKAAAAAPSGFDHEKHRKLFPACETCHLGASEPGKSIWPDSASCATCHDGTIESRVSWQPPTVAPRTNLRFDHTATAEVKLHPAECVDCHAKKGASWMTVERVLPERCLDCHKVTTVHFAAPDSMCAYCHVPLVRATKLVRKEIADFPKPPSHDSSDWVRGSLHGKAAEAGTPVATRCTICHAREFCLTCHVDAPEQKPIQALGMDPRSTAIEVKLEPPPSHADESWLARHGGLARRTPADCVTCHTQESCQTCHVGKARVARALHRSTEPGRGIGAVVSRRRPPWHGDNFATNHADRAAAATATCAACHVRADCLECHRQDAARAAGYHPAGFLARHPAAAYARETSCSSCHNVGAFCTSCHASAGLRAAAGPLGSGYHDGSRFFIVGHGGAARQSLETCVSCHTERDCLTCHSALGGRRFDPHGPGFDPNRLIKKNPQMCTACHGTNIPTR